MPHSDDRHLDKILASYIFPFARADALSAAGLSVLIRDLLLYAAGSGASPPPGISGSGASPPPPPPPAFSSPSRIGKR